MPDPVCLCGCKETTKGGQFRPGHDAKYKSAMIKEAAAGNEDARQILEKRGWLKFLNKHLELETRPPRTKKEPRQAPKTLANIELLQLMKAAARVLRWTGQYRRGTVGYIRITPENALDIAALTYSELSLPTDNIPFRFAEQEEAVIAKALAEREAA